MAQPVHLYLVTQPVHLMLTRTHSGETRTPAKLRNPYTWLRNPYTTRTPRQNRPKCGNFP